MNFQTRLLCIYTSQLTVAQIQQFFICIEGNFKEKQMNIQVFEFCLFSLNDFRKKKNENRWLRPSEIFGGLSINWRNCEAFWNLPQMFSQTFFLDSI